MSLRVGWWLKNEMIAKRMSCWFLCILSKFRYGAKRCNKLNRIDTVHERFQKKLIFWSSKAFLSLALIETSQTFRSLTSSLPRKLGIRGIHLHFPLNFGSFHFLLKRGFNRHGFGSNDFGFFNIELFVRLDFNFSCLFQCLLLDERNLKGERRRGGRRERKIEWQTWMRKEENEGVSKMRRVEESEVRSNEDMWWN